MEKPFQRRQGESKPGRTSFPNRKPFQKNQRRSNPNLTPIAGSPGKFIWNSPDGKVKNLRLPCRYHEDKGVDVYECKNSMPRHCYECSKPGYLAPPIRECKGNHQWKEDKPSPNSGRNTNSRRRMQQSWDGDHSWITKEVILHNKIQKPAITSRVNNINTQVDEIPDTFDNNEKDVCEEPEEDDPFPGDNLEQEIVAKRLFHLADFYPESNVVEAYLRSRNGHGTKNNIQTYGYGVRY